MGFPDLSSIATGAASVINSSRGKTSPSASMRFPSGEIAYGMYFAFKEMQYDLMPGSKAKFTQSISAPQVFLPLPVSGIIESMNINYGANEAGVLGHAAGAGSEMGDAAMASFQGTEASPAQVGAALGRTFGSVGVAARSAIGATSIGAIVDMKTGNVVNPYALTLFQSVAPRAHSFTWKLIPRSQQESESIQKIIKHFQTYSLPTLQAGGTFLGLPQECELAFFGTDKLFKFAKSVVTSVTVNHAPFGVPVFFARDGSPTAIELTLTFQEVESLTRESYLGETA
jgi:hypothetical protein